MKRKIHQKLARAKQKIERRLDKTVIGDCSKPVLSASNIRYEWADRVRGMAWGGIGAMHQMARQLGLVEAIDEKLKLLKFHFPYFESDHVLNIAYNHLCDGECLEDLELRRNDEVYLDSLGARRTPDPTTAGDFCRRFAGADIEELMEAINQTRLKVWAHQRPEFFEQARIDMDGTVVPTCGDCKVGMDITYQGQWGYLAQVISLANTAEPLYILNRSGNRPSHEGVAPYVDRAIALCRQGGFEKILLRGDTDFSQTSHLDRWDEEGAEFVFGMDARANLIEMAQALTKRAWEKLARPPRYEVRTWERERPQNIKEQIVLERGFENLRLRGEHVAEFAYRPVACRKTYRVVVVRKNISVEQGEWELFDKIRYHFYITNIWKGSREHVVLEANQRCNQENLIEQLKNGVRSLRAPVDNLYSNWAYMVMASLAWNLKAWWALMLPEKGRWAQRHGEEKHTVLRMEFKKFVHAFMHIPVQVVRTSRRIVFRVLGWNPWMPVFWRGVSRLRC